ncbi:MAG: hypothetical protein FK734_19915 [Asgard group archaeon]|nr:hypothetical protein [Asgard group archaeon]
MKKQLMIIGIVVILLAVSLSGCNEQSNNSNSGSGYIIIESHNVDDSQANSAWGLIRVYGKIKNIGDKNVDYAEVTVKFYDSDNELLFTNKQQIRYIAKGETEDFSVYYYYYDKYFEQYHHYTVSVWSRI